MKPNQKLIRKQLDSTLEKFKEASLVSIPRKGWVRAVRDALGMTGPQLAKRMQVTKQRVQQLEKDEIAGSTTIKTMRQAAEALNCVFVYSIVPQESLEKVVQKQARIIAEDRLRRISHTMSLEGQELDQPDIQDAMDNLVEELIYTEQRSLWDL